MRVYPPEREPRKTGYWFLVLIFMITMFGIGMAIGMYIGVVYNITPPIKEIINLV